MRPRLRPRAQSLVDRDWRYSRPAGRSDPSQGWKLHISATVLSASEVLAQVSPILRKYDALYKIPARPELLAELNSGLAGFSQVGKFLTVYPRSIAEAIDLARELHEATRRLPGPQIPFDARYRRNSLVYYRYGAFRGQSRAGVIRGPGGRRLPDKRGPGQAVPRWLKDPFNRPCKIPRPRKGPIGSELLAYKARTQRGKGGVYEALDLSDSSMRDVIIKEGRRDGETDLSGQDGYARLRHEARVLRALRRAGAPVPRILREFTQNGNRYLVLEWLAGRVLIPRGRTHPKQFSWRRAEKVLKKLEQALSLVHAAGWVWRDCKPSHIFAHLGKLWLIDFEGARRIDQPEALQWGSPKYMPPGYERKCSRWGGTREDDYALGVIAFQFLAGEFPPARARERARVYRRTDCPDYLRTKIEALFHAASSFPDDRPT